MASRKKKKRRVTGNRNLLLASFAVLAIGVFMLTQMETVREKDEQLEAREAAMEQQLAAESERAEDLMESERYMDTEDFIREIATERLGLVMPGESVVTPKE